MGLAPREPSCHPEGPRWDPAMLAWPWASNLQGRRSEVTVQKPSATRWPRLS